MGNWRRERHLLIGSYRSGQNNGGTGVVASMTAAAIPFARSGFHVLIDFSIPSAYVEVAGKILKEVLFDSVLVRPSLQVCADRAAAQKEGAITDHERLRNSYARFEEGMVETISDDHADPATLAQQIAEGLRQGRFRVSR